ncbi:putative Proteasome subunit A N terminal signature Proteasome subunit [Trypanosoma vivax]|uniref:Proteasome subunit alpha type n=1 Tax=Trypanosoma vivax (strain Y486) TaxID=1055687 RepID=G0U6P3_TRYVY|nr:putative proteasome alpha 1 subunit [Trypanosoma vivax]KAH8611743.1 putative Proteasome subunit A N terminal signature Proteasome subunit [Trypanosoma vivax]CCC51547.1 putative proteasome alpha 1 subunit [Trypanosoma vivax Y486]
MFKNQYDTDTTTWSPSGRLFQVEYANEAVNNGSSAVGVKGAEHVVLTALKRSPVAGFSSYQEKVFKLDDHLGMAVAGLVADGRVLARYLRTECMNYRYMHDSDAPLSLLADMVGEKHQRRIQFAGKRPFGVGLLIAGYDQTGPHLYQTAPSGDVFDFKATAMGLRSQAARTYLEKHFETFHSCDLDALVIHALKALAAATSGGVELNVKNTTIAIVGKGIPFTILTEEVARKYLTGFKIDPEDIPAIPENEEEAQDQSLDVEE